MDTLVTLEIAELLEVEPEELVAEVDDVETAELLDVLLGVVGVVVGAVVGAVVGVVVGTEVVDAEVREKVMQEHAELTAAISLSQLLKSVGIADGAVVVPERNSTQNVSASSAKRGSMRFLKQPSASQLGNCQAFTNPTASAPKPKYRLCMMTASKDRVGFEVSDKVALT